MAFKVGDRIKCVRAEFQKFITNGQVYEVVGTDFPLVEIIGDGGVRCGRYEDRFVLEPLKLEVGATVTIGDGKDGWEVTYVNRIEADLKRGLARCVCGVVSLTVVKAKPQPPKPDYYVNCKGAEPKDGDVFLAAGKVAGIADGFYQFLWGLRLHSLTDPIKAHSIGKEYYPRTLLARDNQPYTGNV